MPRKHFSQRERVRLFTLNGGKCYLCDMPIKVGEVWQIEHEIAWELTRDDSDENLKLAHVHCHKIKTADDIRDIRKADRIKAKHIGANAASRTPMMGSKKSPFKKKMSGAVEKR